MALPIYRLRRVLGTIAVLLTIVVIGMYFYARLRTRDVRKQVPNKIGYDIKQTARGFQFSKSDGKRTLFSVQASDVKEFKLNGRAELHNVSIILYGKDSSRYDQIYGDDFSYEPRSGEVEAKGDVQIDLVANPGGSTSPDQSAPKNVKNAIHLKTRDLIFNKNTGDASTNARVDFSTPQASGWAVGVKYAGKSNVLTLSSQIHMEMSGRSGAVIDADHGIITNEPREITLDHPRLTRKDSNMLADRAVFHLGPEDNIEDIVASGNVVTETQLAKESTKAEEPAELRSRADAADLLLTGNQNLLRTVTLTGNVHVEETGSRAMQGEAGRVILQFAGQNQLQAIHATDGTRLWGENAASEQSRPTSEAQNFEITAPTIDFAMVDGNRLDHAETSGAAKITISPVAIDGPSKGPVENQASQHAPLRVAEDRGADNHPSTRKAGVPATGEGARPSTTFITAGRFVAHFANEQGRSYLTMINGAPNARIVNLTPGQPDRVSTSDSVDAIFLPEGGIESVTQTGKVFYTDNLSPDKRVQAWARNAHYTPSDQTLVLTGNPRVISGSMETTARTIRINRATGEAGADTDVKSTYNDLKAQPDGALLASASPIHVTARSMTAQNNPAVAVYTGNARLWQDGNVIEAPSIQFDRDHRSVIAQGTPGHPVQTVLIQSRHSRADSGRPAAGPGVRDSMDERARSSTEPQKGSSISASESSPISITAAKLTYTDSERNAHYEGGVVAKGSDFSASCKTLDAYLKARGQDSTNQLTDHAGQLDHMVAQKDVVVEQPNRRAEGQNLVYTAADDKFVLTGGSPSIFDAEHGKITGVSLTFFRRDDRVLVEGEASSPVVTETRVAR
jgi:lipopolysaccharide export system protein LptA